MAPPPSLTCHPAALPPWHRRPVRIFLLTGLLLSGLPAQSSIKGKASEMEGEGGEGEGELRVSKTEDEEEGTGQLDNSGDPIDLLHSHSQP